MDARKLKPKPARLRRKETITELFEKRKLVFDLCLKDRQLRAEFLEHVTKELCVESLRFLDAVEAWRNPATQANDDERTLGARSVAQLFVAKSGSLQVYVAASVRERCL